MLEIASRTRQEGEKKVDINPFNKFDLKFEHNDILDDEEEALFLLDLMKNGDRIEIPEEIRSKVLLRVLIGNDSAMVEKKMKALFRLGIDPANAYTTLMSFMQYERIFEYIEFFLEAGVDVSELLQTAFYQKHLFADILKNIEVFERYNITIPLADYVRLLNTTEYSPEILIRFSSQLKSRGINIDVMDLYHKARHKQVLFNEVYEILFEAGMSTHDYIEMVKSSSTSSYTELNYLLEKGVNLHKYFLNDEKFFIRVMNSVSVEKLLSKGYSLEIMYNTLVNHISNRTSLLLLLRNYEHFKKHLNGFDRKVFSKRSLKKTCHMVHFCL